MSTEYDVEKTITNSSIKTLEHMLQNDIHIPFKFHFDVIYKTIHKSIEI